MEGRLAVTAPLVAGTGYLWAPVVVTVADDANGRTIALFRCTQMVLQLGGRESGRVA